MPTALLIENDANVRGPVRRRLRRHGFEVTACGTAEEAEPLLESLRPELVLVDRDPPGGSGLEVAGLFGTGTVPQVIVLSETDTLEMAVEAMRRGAVDVLAKPVDPERLDDALRRVKITLRRHAEVGTLRAQLRSLGRFGRLVGRSESMQVVYDLISKVAPTDSTVMILGETGTGKELVARTIHELSERSDGPFVPVNCGAISANLIESELFGHEKGAFTGAVDRRKGLFEAATGGTLFLDEIAEMPADLQVRLLRVLESGTVRRVGGQRAVRVDARVLAATNRDPDGAVEAGELREDLLYRLMVFPLRIPPLRERRDDVPLLAEHLLADLNRELGKSVTLEPGALEALTAYDWPGNVRELRNVLERSCILARGRIAETDLPIRSGASPESPGGRPPTDRRSPDDTSRGPAPAGSQRVPVGKSIRDVERELILATLEHFRGNRKKAARTLGICAKTLYNRLRSYREKSEAAGPGTRGRARG